ncbi:hypothetical protein ACFPTO_08300 [Paraburkholderia denitrificans]|uniref:DUF4148 domain-containing protein n=1 Tax=Paraburkholderia denitrificans TaxID=694025 RepID=A0ABW0J6X1_9BURK
MKKRVQWTAALGAALLACGVAHAQDAPTTPELQLAASPAQTGQAAATANTRGKTRQQIKDEYIEAVRSGELKELNREFYAHH